MGASSKPASLLLVNEWCSLGTSILINLAKSCSCHRWETMARLRRKGSRLFVNAFLEKHQERVLKPEEVGKNWRLCILKSAKKGIVVVQYPALLGLSKFCIQRLRSNTHYRRNKNNNQNSHFIRMMLERVRRNTYYEEALHLCRITFYVATQKIVAHQVDLLVQNYQCCRLCLLQHFLVWIA